MCRKSCKYGSCYILLSSNMELQTERLGASLSREQEMNVY